MYKSTLVNLRSTYKMSVRFKTDFKNTISNPEIVMIQERKIKVDKYNINYVKVGNGPHSVLCMPGALGNIWTSFKPQIEGFDKEKFSLIAWDPPGQGESKPPMKEFPTYYYEKNMEAAVELMKALHIPKFSLMGWCHGGVTSMMLAVKYPQLVHKLVVWGTRSFILHHELEFYKKMKDISSWSDKLRKQKIELYGEERLPKLWTELIDTLETIYYKKGGNVCSELVQNINCPTFILHGEKDLSVDKIQVYYLHSKIKRSSLYLYPQGKHNIHLRFAEDFNVRVQDFLMQD